MKYIFTIIPLVLIFCSTVWGQHKAEKPQTYQEVCFFTIEQDGFEEYLEMQDLVLNQRYGKVYPAIKEMIKDLKKFDISKIDRSFEFWYTTNYNDFEKQLEIVRQSTLTSLELYETRLKEGKSQYFDHRMFLMLFLAYKTEAFYKEFWFMSIERYFSLKFKNRWDETNKEGYKLFEYSEFYRPFEAFDQMLIQEEDEMKQYLQIGEYGDDSKNIGNKPLIPYSYALLDNITASYLLEIAVFDDASQDLDVDREMRALKRFLQKARSKNIWLIVRFNNIPFREVPRN